MTTGTNVPSIQFTAAGFVAPSATAVLQGVQLDINTAFGQNLNFALTTPQGQLAQSWGAIIVNANSIFVAFSQQTDPAYAVDKWQDAIGRIYFLERNPAEPTQLQIDCTGAEGVVIPVAALVQDTAGNLYQCIEAGTIPVGGSVELPFAAVIPGPTAVPASVTLAQIIPGWDSVAVVSGVVGRNVETRAAFEQRRQDAVAGNSLGPIGAIIGAVAKVSGVLDFYGYNNNTAAPVTVHGVTVAAYAIYISVSGGAPSDIAQAILSKKGAGAPMSGNTTVTVYDDNPLYAAPIAYSITFTVPDSIQLLWSVVLVNNPGIPNNATDLVQAALIAAVTGESNLVPPPPRARIGTDIYAANYIGAITALGTWAQVASLQVGSINTSAVTFDGSISGSTLTVISGSISGGAIAVGQFITDLHNRVANGTKIVSGSGLTWTVNQPQTVAGATAVGNTTGSSVNVTFSSVVGTIEIGDLVDGTGITTGTTIVSQTSGTTGGAGVYVISVAANLSSISCTTTPKIIAATAASSSTTVHADQVPQCTAPNIVVSTT